MSKDTPAGAPAAPDFSKCPDWGKGGKFTFDPASGKRARAVEPVESNAAALGAAPAEQSQPDQVDVGPAGADQPAIADGATQPKKEKARG